MFKHMLVPVDGSATSMLALERARTLASALGSAITVIYVLDPYPFTGIGSEFAYGQEQYLQAATQEAESVLATAREKLSGSPGAVDVRVVESVAPWRGIIEAADTVGADLIVMGSHGRRGLEKLVLGSVTQSVLTHSPITTLVVRGPADD